MARWRLTADHYLNVPGTQWEYEETSRESGKRKREVLVVPLMINLKDPEFQNLDGDVIVCHEGKGEREGRPRGDIIFIGNPTPDMEPLDDEAEAITTSLRHSWEHPIDSLPANGGMTDREQVFMAQMIEAITKAQGGASVPNTGVSVEAFAELQAQMKAIAEQNVALMARLEAVQGDKTEPTSTARRV